MKYAYVESLIQFETTNTNFNYVRKREVAPVNYYSLMIMHADGNRMLIKSLQTSGFCNLLLMALQLRVLLVLVAIVSCTVNAVPETCDAPSDNTTLEFLYMTSFGQSLNSSGSVVGMMMALDRINANSSILADYTLDYSAIIDSQCNRSVSLAAYFQAINDPCRNFISILGSGCSVATEPVAEIAHFWGLTQMSYSSSAGHFEDVTRFRKYLQLYPTEDNLAPAITGLIKYFNWTQVGIITQREALFIRSHDLIRQLLGDLNVAILPGSSFLESFINPSIIGDLFPENGRIFFLNVYEDKARQVICQAYQRGLFGQNYLWILFGWYDNYWWQEPGEFNCTSDELYSVIEGSLAVQHYPLNNDKNRKVIGNISLEEYNDEYSARIADSSYIESFNSHLVYDAVWTLALALDKVIKGQTDDITEVCSNAPVKDTVSEWSYTKNSTASCLVYETLLKTDFEGLSGRIAFDENGTRFDTPVRLVQYRDGNLVPFGFYYNNEITFINDENVGTIFPNGIPPDGQPETIITTIHEALIAVIYSLAIVGILLSVACSIFITAANRKIKDAQLASNVLDYCLLVGVSMTCMSLLFYNTATNPTTITILCYFRLWLSIIGYTIMYSAVLAQMWKIYYVHLNPKNKVTLKIWHLFGFIAVPILVMCVILLLGSTIPSIRPSASLDIDLENPSTTDSRDIVKTFMFYNCYPSGARLLFAVIYIFLGIMQIFQVVLMIQTRKVKISDVKVTAVVIYVTTSVLVVLVILQFTFDGYQNTMAALFTAGYTGSSYTVIIVIFIHKILILRKKDDTKYDVSQGQLSTLNSTVDETRTIKMSELPSEQLKISSLSQEIEKLTSTLERKKRSFSESSNCMNDTIPENN